MKTLLLCATVLSLFPSSSAWARNLSSVDGNILLTKCHPALQMAEVSPKLSQEEWMAAFYCLGFVQGLSSHSKSVDLLWLSLAISLTFSIRKATVEGLWIPFEWSMWLVSRLSTLGKSQGSRVIQRDSSGGLLRMKSLSRHRRLPTRATKR